MKIGDLLRKNKDESWFETNVVDRAPLIMAFFANTVVIFADVRVYDVMYRLTAQNWWKALSSSLACAIPFILWEIGWRYNRTTDGWRMISLIMAGLAFGTSIFLGVADFMGFDSGWSNWLLGSVVVLTGIHTVFGLLYFYNDPDVARKRHQKQAEADMVNQEMNAKVAEQLLSSGRNLLESIKKLEMEYDPEDVEEVLNIIQGKKKSKPTERRRSSDRTVISPSSAPRRLPDPNSNPSDKLDDIVRQIVSRVKSDESPEKTEVGQPVPFSNNGNHKEET